MASPISELTPFPPPPSPPRPGIVGWLQQRISRKSTHELEIPPASLPTRHAPHHLHPHHTHQHPHLQSVIKGALQAPVPYKHHHHSAVIEISRPSSSSEIRRVNFPEPTTTAFFSPPSCPSGASCSTCSLSSSLLQSSLPDTGSVLSVDSPIALQLCSWGRSVTSLSDIIEVASPEPAQPLEEDRQFDDNLTRLVRQDISGISPFLVFLLAMPFVGVATHTGCVAAMGHGVKRAIGGVKIEGGQSVVYPQKEKRHCLAREGEKGGASAGSPVYGVEYTAYQLEGETLEVSTTKRDKGKNRAVE